MATRVTRTTTTPTLSTKCTFSAWVKRTDSAIDNSARDAVLCENYIDGNNYAWIRFDGSDKLNVYGVVSSSAFVSISTNRVFRDTNAWYHVVCVLDSTESTSSDRLKIYVNGVRETDLSGSTYPGSSDNIGFNRSGGTFILGDSLKYTSNFHFDGLYSHVHFIDGAAYQASTFGSTDSSTGEWKINTSPTISEYGANGFFMFKDDASLSDDSGKGNNFTVAAGSIQKTEDNPSNVFTTWNNLCKRQFADKGATEITPDGDADYSYSVSTLGASTGKYYFEFNSSGGNGRALIGMVNSDYAAKQIKDNEEPGANAHSFAYRQNQGDIQMNNSSSSYGSSLGWGTSNNVLMMAVDLDNNKVWYGVDGTWQNSGDPANGTNGFDWSTVRTAGDDYLLLAGDDTSAGYGNIAANFGNGYFGTSAISSEGTNASGIGKFEYNVPNGFTALSTKGLNE